jgi:hypothetical protein
VQLSVAVMTHVLRARLAQDVICALQPLSARLVTDPSPWDKPQTLRTSIRAWSAIDPDSTHHLVLQDDAALSADFVTHVSAIVNANPANPVALYTDWACRNASAVRWATVCGARFVEALPEFVPCIGLVMPRAVAEGFVQFARHCDPDEPDDAAMRRYFAHEGVRLRLAVPSIVDHRPVQSLIGNDLALAGSCCFAPRLPADWFAAPGAVLEEYDLLPAIQRGQVWLCSRVSEDGLRLHGHGTSADVWEKTPLETSAKRIGLDIDRVADRYNAYLSGRPTEETSRLFELLSPRALWSIWLSAFALHWHRHAPHTLPRGLPEPVPELWRRSLLSLLAGGFVNWMTPAREQGVLLGAPEIFLPIAEAGFDAGRSIPG